MDIHNIDDYLDLQDQHELNLLSAEDHGAEQKQEENHSEWHSESAPLIMQDNVLVNNPFMYTDANWSLLQSNAQLEGIDLTQLISQTTNGINNNTSNVGGNLEDKTTTFVAPDSLIKTTPPPPPAPAEEEGQEEEKSEQRITRSRAKGTTAARPKTTETKKRATRQKKLYCLCQQPYNGKPMVQCDQCQEWFHCTCVGFDPDTTDDIDWSCQSCKEKATNQEDNTATVAEKEETKPKPKASKASSPKSPKSPKSPVSPPEPVKTTTRTTRSSKQSKCLYSGCNNRTRADSYCSDVCARKSQEKPTQGSETKSKKKGKNKDSGDKDNDKDNDDDYKEEQEEDDDDENEEDEEDEETEKKTKEEEDKSKKEEEEEDIFAYKPVEPTKRTRISRLRTAASSRGNKKLSVKTKQGGSGDSNDEGKKKEEKEEEEEEEKEEEEEEEESSSKSPSVEPDTPSSESAPMSPSQMSEQINPIRRNVIKNLGQTLATILESAMEKAPDMFQDDQAKSMSLQERGEALAREIENTMFDQLGDLKEGQKQRTCGEYYKSKFRSLLYNLKDKANETFQLRVVTNDLSPMELIKMSSEDMANPELKSMDEVLRKKGLKESVLKIDNTPIIKKTHKGDIIMIPSKNDSATGYTEQTAEKTNIHLPTPVPEPAAPRPDTTFQPLTPTGPDAKMDPLDDILARISIPTTQAEDNKRYATTNLEEEAVKKRKITQDVEDLLGEEEDTPFQVDEVDESEIMNENNQDKEEEQEEQENADSKEGTPMDIDVPQLPTIWEGRINMPQVADFEASARQIGGRMLNKEEWAEVLSPTMWIEGRIPTDRVTNYVTQSQYSTSREIVLLEIEAGSSRSGDTPEIRELNDRQAHTLLEYLETRKRYAVVGHNKTKIKDFYLVPLYKHQHIPDCLYVVRVEETTRVSDLFLGVLILTKQTPAPTLQHHHHQPYIPPHVPSSHYRPSY